MTLFDPKESDGMLDFKVFIPEWYGTFGWNVRAESAEEAAREAVVRAKGEDDSQPKETLTVYVDLSPGDRKTFSVCSATFSVEEEDSE